jgi:hypothetical protein
LSRRRIFPAWEFVLLDERSISQSIRDSQTRLIQSATGTLAIADESARKLPGFVTLHDLLSAQMAVAEREGGSGERIAVTD